MSGHEHGGALNSDQRDALGASKPKAVRALDGTLLATRAEVAREEAELAKDGDFRTPEEIETQAQHDAGDHADCHHTMAEWSEIPRKAKKAPRLVAPILEKPALELLEIATRLAVAVAPSVWRLGIPKERLAQECVDLAAHILQAKRQPIIHEPTGEDIGEVVIGNDGTFWCTPFVDGMLPTTSGPHHSAAAAIKHVRTAYEAHRNALAGCK